jgi:hypothetical protein
MALVGLWWMVVVVVVVVVGGGRAPFPASSEQRPLVLPCPPTRTRPLDPGCCLQHPHLVTVVS